MRTVSLGSRRPCLLRFVKERLESIFLYVLEENIFIYLRVLLFNMG
jgi:hypothetical protein